ncbi:LuxR C-terminal-related transcriptional regulator [Nocardia fusca]|uniref:LuxR C-terminal-related transcriptional regulator n=1 Tax=Nocardia fusca TaxID=941183 RepID=UPI0037C8179B
MDARWPSNLAAEVTSFVGRQRDVEQLRKMLNSGRLITLTGPGGVGKSRLARRFVMTIGNAFPDGVWLVELGELNASDLLPFEVARAIGIGIDNNAGDARATLAKQLAARRLLLVLDNCEHMVTEVVELICTLLGAAPDLRVVTTSRQILGAEGEHIFRVSPLATDSSADFDRPGKLARSSEATQLFIDRATAVVPNLVVDPETMRAVVRLCERLEGMPLAIELAAARLRAYSVDEILGRLEQSFAVLTSGPRSAPPRHRALEATIDWSFRLCTPAEQLLWARLSVFAGGFDLQAAECVCSDDILARPEIFDLLAGLVDKSILNIDRSVPGTSTRFAMLEAVRAFGQARLTDSFADTDTKRRHIEHFAALAQRYHVDYFTERENAWFRAVSIDLPNLRVALQNCMDAHANPRDALQIASCLRVYWTSPGLILEGIQWLRKALDLAPQPSSERAEALWTCAYLELVLGDIDQGARTYAECQDLAADLASERINAFLALCPVFINSLSGDIGSALVHAQHAARLGRSIASPVLTGEALTLAFMMAFRLDKPETRDIGREALDFLEVEGSQFYRAFALLIQALVDCRSGDTAAAMACLVDSYQVFDAVGHDLGIATCLSGFAWVATLSNKPEHGARLLGAAQMLWRAGTMREPFVWFRSKVEQPIESLIQGVIGEKAFMNEFSAGTQLDFHRLISPLAQPDDCDDRQDELSALTPREVAVAELVAKGLSNREIASELVLSRRTVESHVYHLFAKLGLTSRVQVADRLTNLTHENIN